MDPNHDRHWSRSIYGKTSTWNGNPCNGPPIGAKQVASTTWTVCSRHKLDHERCCDDRFQALEGQDDAGGVSSLEDTMTVSASPANSRVPRSPSSNTEMPVPTGMPSPTTFGADFYDGNTDVEPEVQTDVSFTTDRQTDRQTDRSPVTPPTERGNQRGNQVRQAVTPPVTPPVWWRDWRRDCLANLVSSLVSSFCWRRDW
jgi:hypothetical protein